MTEETTQPPPETEEDEDTGSAAAVEYEDQHVHAVYAQIAPHFSATRYKPWPQVARFLNAQPPGSVGIDVGCGNGKYFGVNPGVVLFGSDRSTELIGIAASRNRTLDGFSEAIVADSLALPHACGRFDFAVSVAVVHHFSTRERRIAAVEALLDVVHPGLGEEPGRVLICVWALEQKTSRRGWDAGMQQDVLVPWVMKKGGAGEREPTNDNEHGPDAAERTFHRFYHLYREGELEQDIHAAGGVVLDAGYERDNWWVIAGRQSPQ